MWLGRVEFSGANDLGPLEAGPFLVLDNTAFHQRVRLRAQARRVPAVDARLVNGGDLRLGGAEVVLDGATFGAATSIVGLVTQGYPESGRNGGE